MPDYALRCTDQTCRFEFEAYHGIREDHPPCRKCGAATETDLSKTTVRNLNRVFTDTMSRAFGFHPDEVAEVRALMGPIGNCIRADGEVHFQDRQQEREFRETYIRLRGENERRVQEQAEELAADPEEQEARELVREQAIAAGRDPDEVMEEMADVPVLPGQTGANR
jgi:hypothetical protein